MNTVIITGHLGQAMALQMTPNTNTPIAEANLAVIDGWGEKQKTYWFGLVAFGKSAESIAQHTAKGDKIAVRGRLIQDEWKDKETGKTQRKTRIVVEQWEFAGGKREQSNENGPQSPQNGSGRVATGGEVGNGGNEPRRATSEMVAEESDIPF